MLPKNSFICIGILIAFGIIFPLIVAIVWVIKKKERFTTVLIGALTWLIFAIVLESIPKSFILSPTNPLGAFLANNIFLLSVVAALLAGLFEEIGRYIIFKTFLKNRTNKETAISHGIGHGGFEAMFLLLNAGIQLMVFAIMIEKGTFNQMIDTIVAAGGDPSNLTVIPEQLQTMSLSNNLAACFERCMAMLLHVGLSIIVFTSVRKKKIGLLILAILLHALIDIPAALYQFGVLNLFITEIIISVYAIIVFCFAYKRYYQDLQNE